MSDEPVYDQLCEELGIDPKVVAEEAARLTSEVDTLYRRLRKKLERDR